MTDIFLPIIEAGESLDSAQICAERAASCRSMWWRDFWQYRSAWHLANAIGWASRD